MAKLRNLLCALALGAGSLSAQAAAAAGALAFGSTGDVAKDGYSIGIAYDHDSEEEAKKQAMDWCTSHGSKQTEDRCQIVVTFHKQCVAEAQDPDPGTPGFGWGVAPSEEAAKIAALTNCYATAGKARHDFCKMVNSMCDSKP